MTEAPARQALVAQAERAIAHRIDLFDCPDLDLGREVDWNFEPKAKRRTPTGFAATIDYRDYRAVGDCKWVWEPNRHLQLVVLARAYRITKDERYARAVVEQLVSWMDQCPYGTGMNWRSPLELAIRLINWVWAYELIRPAQAVTDAFRTRWLDCIHRHAWEIARKYSRYSSANNHLIGEAAGVFIASSYFTTFKGAASRRAEARSILEREILEQTYADGGAREQAVGYHLFVLEFFLLAGLAARYSGEDFSSAYWDRVERMFDFLAILHEGGTSLPMFGDSDDGYVLDLGGRDDRAASLLAVGAAIFDRADFKQHATQFSEPAFWLLGPEGKARFDRINLPVAPPVLRPRALPDSGYYLLQRGTQTDGDHVSVTFDCGELGFKSIAAHGHADALSVTLRAAGRDVLVDPGTYDYFTYPKWRDYFRSTRAHNTVVVDGVDQSRMEGPFLWGRRARAKCVRWEPGGEGGLVVGEHDGYAHLPDSVIHRRTVALDEVRTVLTVTDELLCEGRHLCEIFWHFAEDCLVRQTGPSCFEVDFGAGTAVLELDERLSLRLVTGADDPILGWVSRGYHQKRPSSTLTGEMTIDGNVSLTTRITLSITGDELGVGKRAREVGRKQAFVCEPEGVVTAVTGRISHQRKG